MKIIRRLIVFLALFVIIPYFVSVAAGLTQESWPDMIQRLAQIVEILLRDTSQLTGETRQTIRPLTRTYLVPSDTYSQPLVEFSSQPTDCIIYIKQSTIGINIYPGVEEPASGKVFNRYVIGYLLASDGVVQVEKLSNITGPGVVYRMARITVRGITGWVHADPPWTAEASLC